MELASCHSSGASNFQMVPGFLENLWTPGVVTLPTKLYFSYTLLLCRDTTYSQHSEQAACPDKGDWVRQSSYWQNPDLLQACAYRLRCWSPLPPTVWPVKGQETSHTPTLTPATDAHLCEVTVKWQMGIEQGKETFFWKTKPRHRGCRRSYYLRQASYNIYEVHTAVPLKVRLLRYDKGPRFRRTFLPPSSM